MLRIFLFLIALFLSCPAFAADDIPPAFRSTGYALPRFVSLNAGEAFVRAGPDQHYPIKWIYRKSGLPLEVILEFENWRKVRDIDGEEGWVFYSLLSGSRTGIIQGEGLTPLLKKPREDAALRAQLANGVVIKLEKCEPGWCRAKAGDLEGWVQRNFIWGIYGPENFD